jgi:hypothetical protein
MLASVVVRDASIENDAPVPDGAVDANGLDPVTKQRPYLWPSS